MQYTVLGKTGCRVSRLGFGTVHLPMRTSTEVDRDLAIPMLHRAVELGINLFDTAEGYCGQDSQRVLGEAFEGMRDQVVLSTKNFYYERGDKAGWWQRLENSLERLRTDHIDLYYHHALNCALYEQGVAGEGGFYEDMLKAKEQGMIRHICFSSHGPKEDVMKLVDTGLFETVTLQYNLLDRNMEETIAHATESGMGVLLMGPVGGGRLAGPSKLATDLIGEAATTPELALRFVLSNKNVHVALSGMATVEELEQNVATVSAAENFSQAEFDRISSAIKERKELAGLSCTGCNCCLPCPSGVNVPANFETLDLERIFGLTQHARQRYAAMAGNAAMCGVCGRCLEPCPENIDIPGQLGEAVKLFDDRAGGVVGLCELRGGALEDGALRLRLRYMLKNLADHPQMAHVRFLPHGEDEVWPGRFEPGEMEPYARKQQEIEVALPQSAQAYSLDALVAYNGSELIQHHSDLVTAARRADGYALDASERRSGAIHVPSVLHPIHASDDALKGHSFDFAVAYDKENLYVYADVEDDLAAPDGTAPAKGNHLRIHLDGRTPYMIGHGRREDGVTQVTITPPATQECELLVTAANGAEVEAVWERTSTGYRVDCAIPWSAFAQVPAPLAVLGFDVAIRCHDAEGKEVLTLNWTGRRHGKRTVPAFGKVVTV